ncbi:unnamed protein product [Ilex paraguariensis]|uniref:Uncharacterized protein n=1 Tax=Ilex paraguariensis TaxID=185542 RepID=A0ABC8TNC6_9AQUA
MSESKVFVLGVQKSLSSEGGELIDIHGDGMIDIEDATIVERTLRMRRGEGRRRRYGSMPRTTCHRRRALVSGSGALMVRCKGHRAPQARRRGHQA